MQVSYVVAPDTDGKAIGEWSGLIEDWEGDGISNLASRLAIVQEANELIDLLSVLFAITDRKLERFRTMLARNNHG